MFAGFTFFVSADSELVLIIRELEAGSYFICSKFLFTKAVNSAPLRRF